MAKILVSGLTNIETTLQVEGFPVSYNPVRYPFFGIRSLVSGVGYNLSKALTLLGNEVRFATIIGTDVNGELVKRELASLGLPLTYVVEGMDQTAQAIILYDRDGQRAINTDLKDVQERVYPTPLFEQALESCSLAVLANINFSRPYLQLVKPRGIPIATDVHAIADLDDPYNRDFLAAADILFMSDARLPVPAESWAAQVMERYAPEILVIGLGAQGALLSVKQDGSTEIFPAVHTRPIVNTVGAGDALFASFLHFYTKTHDPYQAIQKAILFASYKIGEDGAANGLLDESNLNDLYTNFLSRSRRT
jgi:acarbose 7IV-phosphotransferase